MKLYELAHGVPGATIEGHGDVEIAGVAYDSRRVKTRDLFLAVEGLNSHRHAYLSHTPARGAAALAVDPDVTLPPGPSLLRMPSPRIRVAEPAAQLYSR